MYENQDPAGPSRALVAARQEYARAAALGPRLESDAFECALNVFLAELALGDRVWCVERSPEGGGALSQLLEVAALAPTLVMLRAITPDGRTLGRGQRVIVCRAPQRPNVYGYARPALGGEWPGPLDLFWRLEPVGGVESFRGPL